MAVHRSLREDIARSLQPNPTVDSSHTDEESGTGPFTSNISDLDHLTTYYYVAYATNDVGTAYGEVLELTSLDLPGYVTDIDRNSYPVVAIGSQLWMAENLKATHFANGQPIPNVESTSAWLELTAGEMAYCWHGNSTDNRDITGGLYTWAAAMNGAVSSDANPSGVQGVCPMAAPAQRLGMERTGDVSGHERGRYGQMG